jgi:CO dehydrogenase/acetyl-CoA synthase gamma subunit (corrinoid Fe-S protein)
LEPRPLKPLDKDLAKAIKKRKEKEDIYESLPKIDCGVCGAPTCLTFAEDIVKGEAELTDCIFNLPQKFVDLSQELSKLLNKHPSLRSIISDANKAPKKKD